MRKKTNPIWDVIIVGGGPAGKAAAMVLARTRRRVMLIDAGSPRNEKSHGIFNYLTRDGILPGDFHNTTLAELQKYKVHYLKDRITTAERNESIGFEIKNEKGETFPCRKLLIATGVTDVIPDIPGMAEMWGKGVYHCPFCDGFDLYGQTVGLYARKFNGYGMALALRQLTDKVVLFTDTARYLKTIQLRHLNSRGIEVYSKKVHSLSCDKGKLTCVTFENGESIGCNSLFTHNGIKYNNELIKQLGVRCSAAGASIINKRQECSVPGLYIAGDAAFDMQFVAVAAAEGVKAAVAIHNALLKEDNLATLHQLG